MTHCEDLEYRRTKRHGSHPATDEYYAWDSGVLQAYITVPGGDPSRTVVQICRTAWPWMDSAEVREDFLRRRQTADGSGKF